MLCMGIGKVSIFIGRTYKTSSLFKSNSWLHGYSWLEFCVSDDSILKTFWNHDTYMYKTYCCSSISRKLYARYSWWTIEIISKLFLHLFLLFIQLNSPFPILFPFVYFFLSFSFSIILSWLFPLLCRYLFLVTPRIKIFDTFLQDSNTEGTWPHCVLYLTLYFFVLYAYNDKKGCRFL